MVIHKRTWLTPIHLKIIYRKYTEKKITVSDLAREFHVSRSTIYKIIKRGRPNDFSIHRGTDARYRTVKYGLRLLAKIEKSIEERLKKQAKRYNKDYPGRMVHGDTKRLPLLEG